MKAFLLLTLFITSSIFLSGQVYFETYNHLKTKFNKEIDPLSNFNRVRTYDDIEKAVNIQKSGRKVISFEILDKISRSNRDLLTDLTYLLEIKISTEATKDCPEALAEIRGLKSVIIDNTSGKGVDYDSYAEILKNNSMLQSIEVINCEESSFPSELYNLNQLQQIKLTKGKISKLPDGIASLRRLEYLVLDENNINKLPSDLGSLSYLRVLRLKSNNLSELPKTISGLRNLQYMDLSENKFSEIPDNFRTLSNLKHLNFNKNILILPPENQNNVNLHLDNIMLKDLNSLHLRDCNLEYLPSSVKRLKNIYELDLGGNRLTKLPDEVCELKSLRELYLDKNMLYHLPDSLGNLFNLEILDLDEVRNILDLPKNFADLKNLEVIYFNRATKLNHEALFKKLREIKHLEVLALVGMEIEMIPYDIFREGTFKAISLDYNKINKLPLEICNSQNLEEIRVMDNDLSSIPDCFKRFNKLKYLNISYNNLIDIPTEIYDIESMLYMPTSGNSGIIKPIDNRRKF